LANALQADAFSVSGKPLPAYIKANFGATA